MCIYVYVYMSCIIYMYPVYIHTWHAFKHDIHAMHHVYIHVYIHDIHHVYIMYVYIMFHHVQVHYIHIHIIYNTHTHTHTYIHTFFSHSIFHHVLSQESVHNPLCCTVGLPCLSILNVIVCIYQPQAPRPSHSLPSTPWQPQVCSLRSESVSVYR